MWHMPIQRRHEFINRAKLAEKACIKNPYDTTSKKKWAKALINLGICDYEPSYPGEHYDLLKDALAKLDEVLTAHPEDNEARFSVGLVYYYMLFAWSIEEDDNYDAKLVICDKAIKCFKKVIDEAPELYENYDLMEQIQRLADHYRRFKPTERVQDLLPAESAPPEAEIYGSNKPTEGVQDHLPAKSAPNKYDDLVMYGEDTSFFVSKIALDPDNAAELWKKWGTALMNVSCQESGNIKRVMIAEAIVKLENALLISPNDKKAKQELMKAYDQLFTERHSYFEVERSAGEP